MAGTALGLFLLINFIIGGIHRCYAQSPDVIESMGSSGKINWTAGTIEATGTGTTPEKYYGKPQARVMAQRSAQLEAYKNLMEIIKGIRVDAAMEVKDFMAISELVRDRLEKLAKGAPIVRRDYLAGGTVDITVRLSLRGDFAETILPIVSPGSSASAPKAGAAASPPATNGAEVAGMVIDARGIQARAAMFPRVVDENDQDVYSVTLVDRDYAIQQGMSGYTKDPSTAPSNPRVAPSPIMVKAMKTSGTGRSNIVISNMDAEKIRTSAASAALMKKARVLIVVD